MIVYVPFAAGQSGGRELGELDDTTTLDDNVEDIVIVEEVAKIEETDEELLLNAHGYPANHSGLITETAPASEVPRG